MPSSQIEYLVPEDLAPYSRNARKHSKKQVQQIAASIEKFGFTNPVLIDEDRLILAGHGRVKAAKLLELESVPCLRLLNLTTGQKRAYILADNKLAENAFWDYDLLADELEFLLEHPDEVDVGISGFAIEEIDTIIEPGGTPTDADNDEDDELPEVSGDVEPVTQLGDLWRLGPHLLICGDARDPRVYRELMTVPERLAGAAGRLRGPAEKETQVLADMVFTDPPYNVRIDGNVCGLGTIKHREFAHASGEMSPQQFTDFLTTSLKQLSQFSKKGSIHFVCMDWRHMNELLEAGDAVYSELKKPHCLGQGQWRHGNLLPFPA